MAVDRFAGFAGAGRRGAAGRGAWQLGGLHDGLSGSELCFITFESNRKRPRRFGTHLGKKSDQNRAVHSTGQEDPDRRIGADMERYRHLGGGQALARAAANPAAVREAIRQADLRGLGGSSGRP